MENLLVKQFQENNITIYGTLEKPLFKAKDVGDLLGIKNLKDSIKDYNEKQKDVAVSTDSIGRQQESIMLTEQGLYKVLMKSRKPIAEKFQDWVCQVLEEIRKTGEYKSNTQIEQKTKNTLFIDQYKNKPVLYLGMVENTEEQQIVKYGYTQDIKATLKRHRESYGEEFHYVHALECKEHYNLENQIQNHNDLSTRHVKKYNDKDRQELLRLDKNFSLKDLIELIVKMKDIMENDRNLRLRELDIQEAQINLNHEQEKTKQIETQEKTKQLQIELEILKLKSTKPQATQRPIQQLVQQPQENIELVKKFMNVKTQFSTKRSDYVFIKDLFDIFESWIQETNPGTSSMAKNTFSRTIATIQDYTVERIVTGPRVGSSIPRKVAIVNRKLI